VFGGEWLIPRLETLLDLAIVVDIAADGQLRSKLGEGFFELGALLGASLVEWLDGIDVSRHFNISSVEFLSHVWLIARIGEAEGCCRLASKLNQRPSRERSQTRRKRPR
jgi:hypothetical protein